MFLRLQAPNLASALPFSNQSQQVKKRISRRKLSDTSTISSGSTVKTLKQNKLTKEEKNTCCLSVLNIRLDDSTPPTYESLENIETVYIHEPVLLDCNAQVAINKFLRSLTNYVGNFEKLVKVVVLRQLTKNPPLQTCTNAFIRGLPSYITIEVHLNITGKQCIFPPGDLELYQNIVSISMFQVFSTSSRFENKPLTMLRELTLVDNYTIYADKQAEQIFSSCDNLKYAVLDVDYLTRVSWLPDSVHTLTLKPSKFTTNTNDTIKCYPHIRHLTIDIHSSNDLTAIQTLRFIHLSSLSINLKVPISISGTLDTCLDTHYPDTLTLNLPNDLPLSQTVAPLFADEIVLLRIVPNTNTNADTSSPHGGTSSSTPFRVDMALIETMFPRLKILDVSSSSSTHNP